jgi:hypothetical protein
MESTALIDLDFMSIANYVLTHLLHHYAASLASAAKMARWTDALIRGRSFRAGRIGCGSIRPNDVASKQTSQFSAAQV